MSVVKYDYSVTNFSVYPILDLFYHIGNTHTHTHATNTYARMCVCVRARAYFSKHMQSHANKIFRIICHTETFLRKLGYVTLKVNTV